MSSQLQAWVGLQAWFTRESLTAAASSALTWLLRKAGRNWKKVLLGLLLLRIFMTRRRSKRYWARIREMEARRQERMLKQREEEQRRYLLLQNPLLRSLPPILSGSGAEDSEVEDSELEGEDGRVSAETDSELDEAAAAAEGEEEEEEEEEEIVGREDEGFQGLRDLSGTKLAAVMGTEILKELVPHLRKIKLKPGDILWAHGERIRDPGMYIVSRGKLGLFSPKNELMCSFNPGESVGDFALLQSGAASEAQARSHAVSCAALAPTLLYFLSTEAFVGFSEAHSEKFLQFLRSVIAREWRVASYVFDQFLSLPALNREEIQGDEQTGMVQFRTPGERNRVGRVAFRSVRLPSRGSVLFRTGQPARSMFFLVSGSLLTSSSLGGVGQEDTPEPVQGERSRFPEAAVAQDDSALVGESSGGPGERELVLQRSRSEGRIRNLSTQLSREDDDGGDDPTAATEDGGDADEDEDEYDGEELDLDYASEEDWEFQGRIPAGSVVGGMSLFSGTERGETVFAAEPCRLWEFDMRSFEQHPQLLLPLMEAVARQLVPTLRQFFEFGMQPAVFSAGRTVFRQGDPAREMMLVLSGRVRAIQLQSVEPIQYALWEQVEQSRIPNSYRVLFEVSRGETLGWDEAFGNPSFSSSRKKKKKKRRRGKQEARGRTRSRRSSYSQLESFEDPLLHPLQQNTLPGEFSRSRRKSLLSRGARSIAARHYTAVCTRDTELVTISRTSFELVFQRNPVAMLRFTQLMARRLQALTQDFAPLYPDPSGGLLLPHPRSGGGKRFQNLAVISLVPIGRHTLSVRDNLTGVSSEATLRLRQASMKANFEAFALRLASALSAHGPTLHLNKQRLALLLGPGTLKHLRNLDNPVERQRMVLWLAQQEENFRFLLLEADADWMDPPEDSEAAPPSLEEHGEEPPPYCDAWTRICIGQADCVLCVGHATASDKTVNRQEQNFLWHTQRRPHRSSGGAPGKRNPSPQQQQQQQKTLPRTQSQLRMSREAATGLWLSRQHGSHSAGLSGLGNLLPSSPPGAPSGAVGSPSLQPRYSTIGTATSQTMTPDAPLAGMAGRRSPGSPTQDPSPSAALITSNLSQVSGQNLEDLPFWSKAASAFRDLVILHPHTSTEELPRGTKDWFVGRQQLRSHHHVRTRVDADYERLARFLAGTSVGVVLSGGGAKGLAHLGALQALEEHGVPIDYIAGSSQGAFMAALYARYLSAEKMDAPLRDWVKIFRPLGLLRSLTLPILSWFNGSEMTAAIRKTMGESTQIEDLWIPYFCTTTNLRQADLNIHTQGSLWFYCRASMGVVGLLPPMIDTNGDLLIDGGYTSNLPADIMATKVETVIAVDVENKDVSGFDHIHNYGDGVSGWWILWQKLTLTHRVPLFGEMVNWLSCINHTRHLILMQNQPGLIDLYIRPLVQHFGLIDYHHVDELSRIGYQTALPALRRWLRTRQRKPQSADFLLLEGDFLEDYTLITPRPDHSIPSPVATTPLASSPSSSASSSSSSSSASSSSAAAAIIKRRGKDRADILLGVPDREPSPSPLPFSAQPGIGSRRPSFSEALGALHPGSPVLARLPTSSSAHNLSRSYTPSRGSWKNVESSGSLDPRSSSHRKPKPAGSSEQGQSGDETNLPNLKYHPHRMGRSVTEKGDRGQGHRRRKGRAAGGGPQILSWANATPKRPENRLSMADEAEYRWQEALEESIGSRLDRRMRRNRSPRKVSSQKEEPRQERQEMKEQGMRDRKMDSLSPQTPPERSPVRTAAADVNLSAASRPPVQTQAAVSSPAAMATEIAESDPDMVCFDAETGALDRPRTPFLDPKHNLPHQLPQLRHAPAVPESSSDEVEEQKSGRKEEDEEDDGGERAEELDQIPSRPEHVVVDHVQLPEKTSRSPVEERKKSGGGLRRNVSMRMLKALEEEEEEEETDGEGEEEDSIRDRFRLDLVAEEEEEEIAAGAGAGAVGHYSLQQPQQQRMIQPSHARKISRQRRRRRRREQSEAEWEPTHY